MYVCVCVCVCVCVHMCVCVLAGEFDYLSLAKQLLFRGWGGVEGQHFVFCLYIHVLELTLSVLSQLPVTPHNDSWGPRAGRRTKDSERERERDSDHAANSHTHPPTCMHSHTHPLHMLTALLFYRLQIRFYYFIILHILFTNTVYRLDCKS